jgi:hypothetical protein
MDAVSGVVKFAPSYDIEGDCGVCLPFQFSSVEAAINFEKGIGTNRPINTGKHVYSNWLNVMNKRGGHCEAANPYNFPANKGLNMDFNPDSCPKSLDYLKRTEKIKLIKDAL